MIYAPGPAAAAGEDGSPAVGSPPARTIRRPAMASNTTGATSFLRRMPESLALHVLKFLPLEDLLGKVALLDSYSASIARSADLWENHLTELYPLPELLEPVEQRAPLAERRSKGKVQIARMKGTGKLFAIRTVSLETTNAGKDDGIPTSCLRELSVSGDVRHPNVLRCLGGWVDGPILTIVSEYCGNSLFSTLNAAHTGLPAPTVKSLMRQLVAGVEALHQRGIIHRNLKSDNIILTDATLHGGGEPTLKICDLSTSRLLDQPVGAYTPEDPKERDRSYREQRRLYNRSPEVILRQPLYGGELDIWSVGCLFVELALGEPPFRCESEIGLLLSAVQICGTPPVALWDRLSASPQIFVRLPRWDPIDFRAVARVLCDPQLRALGVNAPPLLRYHPRQDCLLMLLKFGAKVGVAGLMLLERLLIMPSCFRVTAQEIRSFPYFRDDDPQAVAEMDAWVQSYTPPPPAVLQNQSAETRSLIHFQRFIDIEKQRYNNLRKNEGNNTQEEDILISCIRAMDERSFGVPANYLTLASIPYDYAEELVKLRAAIAKRSTGGSAAPTPFHHGAADAAGVSNLECQLTPAPTNRSAANGGRRGRQETEQIASSRFCDGAVVATRTPPGENSSSNSVRRHNVAASQLPMQLDSQTSIVASPSNNSGLVSNASPHTDGTCCSLWETDWQTQLDFELDHECHLPHRAAIAAPAFRPWSSCESTQASAAGPPKSQQQQQADGAGDSGGGSMSYLGVSDRIGLLTHEQRKLVALCQSPLNAVKTCGICPTTPGDSLHSVFRRKTRLTKMQAAALASEGGAVGQGTQWIGQKTQIAWAKLQQPLPWLRPRVSPRARLEIVNFMLGIQPEFLLRSQTLHLAVSLFDRYSCHLLGQPSDFTSCDFVPLALTCLKIADIYNEISKEYYKQDNIVEYCEYSLAPGAHLDEMVDEKGRLLRSVTVTPAELLAEEKKVLNLLAFRVMHPTTCWLVDAYLCKAKLLHLPELVDYCHYLADLGLYCHRLLAFRPALQAQCILLIACSTLYRPRCEGVIIRHTHPKYWRALAHFLQHFCRHRDTLCAANNVWEVLDCLAVFEVLLTDGKRLFEAMALRSVERIHSWVGRTAVNVATGISPSCVRCILPSSQDTVLASLEEELIG